MDASGISALQHKIMGMCKEIVKKKKKKSHLQPEKKGLDKLKNPSKLKKTLRTQNQANLPKYTNQKCVVYLQNLCILSKSVLINIFGKSIRFWTSGQKALSYQR